LTVTLRQPLTLAEAHQIRVWRDDPAVTPMLRTGAKTEAEQTAWYHAHIAPRWWQRRYWQPEHRYYAVELWGRFVGITGLTYIQDGEAEISLVLGPTFRGKGVGGKVVSLLLEEARRLGLSSVRGECYRKGALAFWRQQAMERKPVEFATHDDGTFTWRWTL
jgi:RimJ/RimL family protein N-acetyltransferase